MAGYKDIFQEKGNRNWLKAVLAVQVTKDGLLNFVKNVATELQQDILRDIISSNGLLPGSTCNKCRTENVLTCKTQGICSQTHSCKFHKSVETQPRQCVAKVCNNFQSSIRKYHRFDRPSWCNTDSTKWCIESWEVAKCYFPPDGYHDKQSADDTDLNGVISPIINCTYFQQFMDENLNQSSNTFTMARDVGRHLRHSTTLLVTDTDLAEYFTVLKKALCDPKRLQNDDGAKSAVTKLSKLEVDQLVITTDDVVKVIQDTIKQTRQLQDDLRDLNTDTHDLQNKLADLQTLENEIKQIVSKECGIAIKAIQDKTETKVGDLKALGDKLEKHSQERILYTRDSAVKDVEKASEHVTKAVTKEIKIAGQMEENRVKNAGQMAESLVKNAGQVEESRVKNAGQMEESRVKNAGQMEESRVKNAGQMEENHVKNAGQMEENRVKETGKRVKLDVELTGEHIAQKIELSGQLAESRIRETGQMVKQDAVDIREAAMVKFKSDVYSEAGAACSVAMADVEAKTRKIIHEIKTQQNKPADEIYDERKHELQHALAQHYCTEHDSMPLLPLMPEIDDKLTKFFIAPKMNKMDTKSSTQSVQTQDKVVDTYKALFYDVNDPHRNIYIQGEAGIGKTTFCTKLGLVWSEIKFPEGSKKDSSIEISTVKLKPTQKFCDESVINEFDFVFTLALRNVDGECELERMIETQIVSELPDCTKYDGLVPKILDKERCLIILDGLDEWSHQRSLCKKSSNVPHRKSWSNTTVLTSSRPWKMNEVRLRDSEISTLIQVTGITNSETFIEKVLNCLNDKYQTKRDARDFITYMKDKQLKHFLDTPIVAMQLLWLWHNGHELGDSKCKIYINMLDMLFGRAEENSPSACDDIADSLKAGLPPCFESTEFCEQHKMLLDCLGSLAFHTLYSSKREETLVFNESIVKSHVKSYAALKTALITGILSQYKSPSRTVRRSHFSFLHKTFQEFLAAYHIATHVDESENIVQTLFQVYGQTVDIMDISELFIFVCGLNTEMACKISDSVMKSFSVKLTNHIEELHVSGGGYDVAYMTQSLQKMILAGYKESISNGHQDPQLALHHVYYYSDSSDDDNRDISDDDNSVNSDDDDRYISGDDKIYQDILVGRNKDKIVTLSAGKWLQKCTVDVVKIQQILTQSSSTLSHVSLHDVEGLTDASLDLFTNITLKSLYLQWINTHFDIKLNTSSLLYCCLVGINKEVEHSVLSALTTAPKLHTLEVGYCENMSLLCQVLPTLPMLHKLHEEEGVMMIPVSLCQVMSTLSQLQRLSVGGNGREDLDGCEDLSLLCQLPSTLSNLQYIKLVWTDLGDNDILLPNSIQEIELHYVTLTCRSFRQLVDRLTQIPHKVTCKLVLCTVRPEEEWDEEWDSDEEEWRLETGVEWDEVWDSDEEEWRLETEKEWDAIVKHIQQTHMFEIHRNYIHSPGLITLHFTKI